MPLYQNSTVDSDKLILGNCKIETASSSGATFVNLGAGIVNSFTHSPVMYDVQAGNAPDPIEGVADETATIEFEMIEYNASALNAIHGGLLSYTATTVLTTITAGGNATITPRAFRLTNTRIIDTTTVQTILTCYKATMQTGVVINFQDDNATDPIAVLPGTILAKLDTTRTVGQQLYTLTRTVPPA